MTRDHIIAELRDAVELEEDTRQSVEKYISYLYARHCPNGGAPPTTYNRVLELMRLSDGSLRMEVLDHYTGYVTCDASIEVYNDVLCMLTR